MNKNVEFLGQVFTNQLIVEQMISLIKNKGRLLEPSCGDGAFYLPIKKKKEILGITEIIGIEFDSKVCPSSALNMDFFDYSIEEKFDTIIGNPPYVKFKNMMESTKNKLNMDLFNERSNLYLFFIEKCIRQLKENGELIFIVPRDFIKTSASIHLNHFIYEQGTMTHWIDLGDKIIFPGFSPNCVIFRFEKNNFSRQTLIEDKKYKFKEVNGQLLFVENDYPALFSDLFFVKVGGASGADKLFAHEKGNQEFVCSTTKETQQTKRMFYNLNAPELLPIKEDLMNRKIKHFTEKNWYMWGRNYFKSNLPRIYVNVKTRKNNPFFTHPCKAYDGSILAIFPKFHVSQEQLDIICQALNNVNWGELGFICDGRYLFTQRSLEQTALPIAFISLLNK